MQYILTEEELQDIKSQAKRQGFRDAEALLGRVLGGARDLRIVHGEGVNRVQEIVTEHSTCYWGRLLKLVKRGT